VMEVVFLSMGMSVVIAQTAAPYLYKAVVDYDPDMYMVMEEMIIDMTIYLGPFVLLLLTFIMPVMWVAEDTQAYRINQYQDSVRLGFYLRKGVLSKILGFFGLVLVFTLARQFSAALATGGDEMSYMELMQSPDLMTNTLVWFLIILLMSFPLPFLVTLVYLSRYHERWVNNVRVQASEFMELGTMEIRKPKLANIQYLKRSEMVDESGGFFQSKHGKIILLAFIILVAVICIYISFIMAFPSDPLLPFWDSVSESLSIDLA